VRYCFQYDTGMNCIKCNNYDESNPDTLYLETLDNNVQGIFALVSGETDRLRQCQFMYYCASATRALTTTYVPFYKCNKCISWIKFTQPNVLEKQRVAQFTSRDYGKRYYKLENDGDKT